MESDIETPRPRSKAEVMARIEQARSALEEIIANATDTQVMTPRQEGGWSVKDHLAHLSAWEGRALAFLQGRTRADYFQIPQADIQALEVDGINDVIAVRNRQRSLADVLSDWRTTHAQVVNAIGQMSDADLAEPFSDPDDPSDREPLLGSNAFDGNTYAHYEEHTAMIQTLLR